eukprot:Skav200156  [mRNA]  locus=scaffold4148:25539:36637:- [translate_table: standard]
MMGSEMLTASLGLPRIRNAGAAVAQHVGKLMPVLARQASPEAGAGQEKQSHARRDASASARVDLLGLVHFLVNEEEPSCGDEALAEAVKQNSLALLDGWQLNSGELPGQSNGKIRRGGMVCVHSILRRHLVPATVLNEVFVDLMPILKSCLDDSWSPDNRMIACLVLSCTLSDLQDEINGEQLREARNATPRVYPELLKRLDDSNDKIRVAVCEALNVFFKCLPHKWSRSLFEYILRNLFVHLDDPNPEVQLCEELVRLAESLQKASGEEG